LSCEVAFLRAVNVAGHGSLKMSDLRRVFESAGCKNVRTYIQSGNVVFEPPGKGSSTLRPRVARSLARLLGKDVVVTYRGVRDLQRTLAAAPFGSLEVEPDVKLYVGFLAAEPKSVPVFPLASAKDGLEVIKMTKREVFVVSRKVKGRYGFPNGLIEKEFAVPATTRNWNTVRKIVALATEGAEG
jgi:uncharacterized protein (DUF1697 family)